MFRQHTKSLNELKQLGELNTQLAVENLVSDIIVGYYNYIQQVHAPKNLEICSCTFKGAVKD